jgi:hypothetical protein
MPKSRECIWQLSAPTRTAPFKLHIISSFAGDSMWTTYEYMYICTFYTYIVHTYIHTHVHTYTNTHIHTCMQSYVRTYIHTYIHTHTQTHTHTHTHAYDFVCVVVKPRRCGVSCPGSNPGGGGDFPNLSRLALWPTHPSVQWIPGLFPTAKAAGVWGWPPTPI